MLAPELTIPASESNDLHGDDYIVVQCNQSQGGTKRKATKRRVVNRR